MANDIYDNRTKNLNLPLPNVRNPLARDCLRIAESLNTLDEHVGELETGIKASADAIIALQKRAAALEDVDGEHGQALENLAASLDGHSDEISELEENLEQEKSGRENAMNEHEASTDAHAALFRHLATGSLSPVIGICLAEEGGGVGSWVNVDVEGNPISPPKSYFDHHPVYSGIRRVLVDGQIMQEHTKFYHKTFEITSGLLSGRWARIISPEPLEGFKPFPSFMKNGAEIDHWYCGTYQAIDTTPDAATAQKILGSRPGKQPFTNVDFPTMQSLARARNVGGVTGFDIWDIYQAAEIQLLYLIEYANSDSQAAIGPGWVDGQWRKVNNVYQFDAKNVDDPTVASASWRGHVGLWGNVWQMCDGLRTRDSDKHIMIYKNDGSKTWVDTGIVAPERAKFGTVYNHAWPVNFRHQTGNGFDLGDIFYPQSLSIGNQDDSGASIPDAFWGWQPETVGDRVCYLGAEWFDGSLAGLFACALHAPASNANIHIGCRLARS